MPLLAGQAQKFAKRRGHECRVTRHHVCGDARSIQHIARLRNLLVTAACFLLRFRSRSPFLLLQLGARRSRAHLPPELQLALSLKARARLAKLGAVSRQIAGPPSQQLPPAAWLLSLKAGDS